jgi:hypothetical protein
MNKNEYPYFNNLILAVIDFLSGAVAFDRSTVLDGIIVDEVEAADTSL